MLLELTSTSSCSEIRNLDIRFYTKFERKSCFNVIKPTKTSKANKPLPVLEFERFEDDNSICAFETLEEYIFRSKPWREKSNHTKSLLSHIEPNSSVKTCVLSRRICQVLKYAGINTKMFTLKYWVYLSVKFSKRVCGPKNQHGKNSIIKRYFAETTTFQSTVALSIDDK